MSGKPPTQPRPTRTFTRICAYCGQPFQAESDRARYCCPAHKQAAYRDRITRKAGRYGARVVTVTPKES